MLVRLATHEAGRHGLAQRKGQLPDGAVEALLRHGGSRSAVFLHGRRVSPAMRRRIAEYADPAIRDAYADFVRTVVGNGVAMGVEDLAEAYGRPLAELAAATDPKLRVAVARAWRDRPTAVQLALLTDPDPRVRAAASQAGQPGVPPEYQERCLADPAVQANIAGTLPLTPDQFARLLATGDQAMLHAVAENPHLTADMVAQLQDSTDPSVRLAVAYSRHATPEIRDRLLARVRSGSTTLGDQLRPWGDD